MNKTEETSQYMKKSSHILAGKYVCVSIIYTDEIKRSQRFRFSIVYVFVYFPLAVYVKKKCNMLCVFSKNIVNDTSRIG